MSSRENKRAKLSEDGEANGMQSDFLKGKPIAQFGLKISSLISNFAVHK